MGSGLHALLLQDKIVASNLNKFTDFLVKDNNFNTKHAVSIVQDHGISYHVPTN